MRILFIANAPAQPLGVMYLSALLKRAGHKVRLVDSAVAEAVATVRDYRPDVLGFSAVVGSTQNYVRLNSHLKKNTEAFSIFGGPDPTFAARQLVSLQGVEAVCVGEGEGAILDLAERLEDGRSYSDIANLWVKNGDSLVENPVRPLLDDLDSLPFPDWGVLPAKFQAELRNELPVMASRGCPFNCSFCSNHAYKKLYKGKGRILRWRSPENVVEEIMEARRRYQVRSVNFRDDNFLFNREWLKDFAGLYRRKVGLPFWCQIIPSLVEDELLEDLRKAGCVTVTIGIETADEGLREAVLKKKISTPQIIEACRLIKRHGLRVFSHNMLGLPNSSLAQDLETLELNARAGVDYTASTLYTPLPATELGDYCVEHKLFDGDLQSLTDVPFTSSVLRIPRRRERENLSSLFVLGSRSLLLCGLVKRLIRLPVRPLYRLVDQWMASFQYAKVKPYLARRTRLGQFGISLHYASRNVGRSLIRKLSRAREAGASAARSTR